MAEDVSPKKEHVQSVLTKVSNAGNTLLSLLAGLLAAFLILYSGYVLYDTFYTSNQAFSSTWDLLQYRPQIIDDGATPLTGGETLESINEDYRAWLTMYETKIDYPVMQGPNDLYYASHDMYGNYSLTGALYLSASNTEDFSDTYNLIYGHHMANGAMFGALDKFLIEDYFNEHREGVLITKRGVYDLTTFAVCRTDAYESNIYTVGNRMNEVVSYLESCTGAGDGVTTTVIFDRTPLEDATQIVAMSTCANATTNGRLVVYAVMKQRPLIVLDAVGYEGVYDAYPHTGSASSNYEGTTIYYSVDGGETWTTEMPTITNVGSVEVLVRAENPYYGNAETTVVLRVLPRPATVTAIDASKYYGQSDPAFSAVVTGIIDNTELVYTVTRPNAGVDEDVGLYVDAIVPSGEVLQGNYTVTYVPANFTILPSDALRISATGYRGVYDADPHGPSVTPTVEEGTTIYYSTDGGETWTTEPPTITNVGEVEVLIRAENPNYLPVTTTVTLTVTPRPAIVTANPAAKVYGTNDPTFTAVVTGVLNNDPIAYTVARPGAGTDEDVGTYTDAVIPSGEAVQGNYTVTYIPANFTITSGGALVLIANGYNGVYDANPHAATATVNIPTGTKIEYSLDGETWTETPPSITNVGSQTVYVRATNPNYDPVQTTVTLTVTPRHVVVTAHDAEKLFGTNDPAFSATVTGVIDDYEIVYTLSRPGAGVDEAAGEYPQAIIPAGEATQGNYTVTYIPATMTIIPSPTLSLAAQGYDGVYDAESHTLENVTVNITEGTTIQYSIDGGRTWSDAMPEILNVGELEVLVRAENPNYETVTTMVTLRVRPRMVTVTANGSSKLHGTRDPEFTATVEGVIDDFTIVYTVTRPGGEEDVGRYQNAIVPSGEREQGNYIVTYIPANFVIIDNSGTTPTDPTNPSDPTDPTNPDDPGRPSDPNYPNEEDEPLYDIDDPTTPLAIITQLFEPTGGSYGRAAWALVNLICVILTAYTLLPLLHLKAKFGRGRLMKKVNKAKSDLLTALELEEKEAEEKQRIDRVAVAVHEKQSKKEIEKTARIWKPLSEMLMPEGITTEEYSEAVQTLYYRVKKFLRKFWAAIVGELLVTILAIVVFILTEDMRLPMVLIDKWTPLMILILLVCWTIDVALARYRNEVLAEADEVEENASMIDNTPSAPTPSET